MQPLSPADLDGGLGEAELWHLLRRVGDEGARERLFAMHLAFARSVAVRFFLGRPNADLEFAEILQMAFAGLLQAIDRYDPTLGVPFKAYAARRINGSMLDGVSKSSELRQQMSCRARVRAERLRSLGPSDKDRAGGLRAMDALVDIAVGLAIGLMLEGTGLYAQDDEKDWRPNAYESLAWKEATRRLRAELVRLPQRERSVIELHYLHGVSFDQVGLLWGVSKGRISQLHKAALMLLKKRLAAAGCGSLSLEG